MYDELKNYIHNCSFQISLRNIVLHDRNCETVLNLKKLYISLYNIMLQCPSCIFERLLYYTLCLCQFRLPCTFILKMDFVYVRITTLHCVYHTGNQQSHKEEMIKSVELNGSCCFCRIR